MEDALRSVIYDIKLTIEQGFTKDQAIEIVKISSKKEDTKYVVSYLDNLSDCVKLIGEAIHRLDIPDNSQALIDCSSAIYNIATAIEDKIK